MAISNKPFDAVRMMCLIRDKLSEQISGMTFEEEQAYIRQRYRGGPVDVITGSTVLFTSSHSSLVGLDVGYLQFMKINGSGQLLFLTTDH